MILHRDTSVPVVSVNVWYHVGSGNERPGRTGFAHLFEHVMFEGSMHVPEGSFDNWLEAAGGNNNGSTTNDRTNYYEDLPANALELALFLESDRMGFLLDDKAPDKINGQRDVVKNEKRQSVDNQPYGQAFIELPALLYPPGHPYSWSTIGSMEDLTAASFEDVARFFRTYYVPGNASLVIAGDIDIAQHAQAGREVVQRRAGRQARAAADGADRRARRREEEDHHRSRAAAAPLSRVAHAGAAEARRRGDGHRLEPADGRQELAALQRLVYELQIAQDVNAVPAVAGARQQLRDHRDGPARPVARQDPGGDRRRARQAARRRRRTRAR